MATHGHKSWALTSLGAWRDQSLSSSGDGNSSAFIKSRQREARRAMLGANGGAPAATTADSPVEEGAGASAGADCWGAGSVPAKKPPGGEAPSDMAVG